MAAGSLGLGNDVAISVRAPAHFTGIVALKATHGSIPYTGHSIDAVHCSRACLGRGPRHLEPEVTISTSVQNPCMSRS
ncbi:amidase family protein [Streptomyces afghaniensis]|uniref:amidase family protein n=1 Tax=Streptomyces afghaniensis TaxID=66865 RepID=UPI0037D2B6EF